MFALCKDLAKQKLTTLVAPQWQQSTMAAVRRNFSCLAEEKRVMKDHNRRLMAEKFEVKRNLYKALCRNPDLPAELREKQRYKLSKLPRNSAFSRIRNRCILTGRPRAVYQLFRMSRICFRELASKGALMGIKKASW
ncbi:OLC1v1020884C1 [Oldenlandia corymbosa var. corymbosa]|uniref:Small ribosomal subunit protein uS14c n=1 Tax=Oldenlandia corymbosa var. corymbosa TaxID=529605 RepID=A0AAV1BUR3_OLDCO|nr:OLC1v1020884C1 [Oldenlandia corymbosa var. corymbosa]